MNRRRIGEQIDMDVLEAELTGLGGEVDEEKRGREKATRITS